MLRNVDCSAGKQVSKEEGINRLAPSSTMGWVAEVCALDEVDLRHSVIIITPRVAGWELLWSGFCFRCY